MNFAPWEAWLVCETGAGERVLPGRMPRPLAVIIRPTPADIRNGMECVYSSSTSR